MTPWSASPKPTKNQITKCKKSWKKINTESEKSFIIIKLYAHTHIQKEGEQKIRLCFKIVTFVQKNVA